MKRPKLPIVGPPDYLGVGTTIQAPSGDEIIIVAKDLEVLKAYLSNDPGYPESRKVAIYLGPMVEIGAIQHNHAAEFAAKLGTREMGSEITPEEEAEAKALGLVVVFGYSDDCTEFRGAIHDEDEDGEITVSAQGKILSEYQLDAMESLRADGTLKKLPTLGRINACWCKPEAGYCWTYETTIPHASFDVLEDGDKFCRAIVFSLSDIS